MRYPSLFALQNGYGLPTIVRALVCSALALILTGPAEAGRRQSPSIDAAGVASTVDSLASVIEREYFDAGVAATVDRLLRRSLADGRYSSAATADALADMLSRDLYAATKDKHLVVSVQPAAAAFPSAPPSAADDRGRAGRRSNFGVRRVEILAGNVGYIELTSFFRVEEARDALAAAMRLVTNADALIIDMRANGGGSPGTVALLMGYLLERPATPLFDIEHRAPEPADHYATDATPPADRDAVRPMAVLTSSKTFSAGEGFAFLMQERHRAAIVGEVTAGAANPGRSYPVNARFNVTVPNGRVRGAVSGRNWEGTGVIPDVKVAATDALDTAHARLLEQLRVR